MYHYKLHPTREALAFKENPLAVNPFHLGLVIQDQCYGNVMRASKYDPAVDEVELIEANPNYAHIRY